MALKDFSYGKPMSEQECPRGTHTEAEDSKRSRGKNKECQKVTIIHQCQFHAVPHCGVWDSIGC